MTKFIKVKNILLFLLVFSSIIFYAAVFFKSNAYLNIAADDVQWSINAGDKYRWDVVASNVTLGFLPVGSYYEIKINSTTSSSTESIINVTLTKYNSSDGSTTVVLLNQMFIYFNNDTSTTLLYAPFIDHGFFLPLNCRDQFFDGLTGSSGYWDDLDTFNSVTVTNYQKNVIGRNNSNNIKVSWFFNDNYITRVLTITPKDSEELLYRAVLSDDDGGPIPFGNLFLISIGLAVIVLIYFYEQKHNYFKSS